MSLHGLADGARDSDGMFASFNDDALMEQLLEVWRISEFRLSASGNHAAASPRNRGEDLALLNAEGSNIFDAEVRLVQEHQIIGQSLHHAWQKHIVILIAGIENQRFVAQSC